MARSFRQKLRKFNRWIHLWLGLLSGIIIFIVSITGSIYVFKDEITNSLEPWRFVNRQDAAFASPSRLIDSAKLYVIDKEPTGITYNGKGGAAAVGFWYSDKNKSSYEVVYLNPYTAELIKKTSPMIKGKFDFFSFILHGHRALWLPYKIGRPIVGVGVILFVIMLISGLILWWPRKWTKKGLNRNLTIKNYTYKRFTHDLHNVLGFYVFLFAIVLALTGLTWTFTWMDKAFYFVTSFGGTKTEQMTPHSLIENSDKSIQDSVNVLDMALLKALDEEPDPERIYIYPSYKAKDDPIKIYFYKYNKRYYHRNSYYYDQYTLDPIRVLGDRYDEAVAADKLHLMIYDIHTGGIGGLPGKVFAFLVSLICASLPITGFLIWRHKKP